ncbi:hypothetical protein NP92_01900 [Anoxybacillus gonensis]|uniref:Uncharacterized protein n=1 Tax=Anoxybacillus gonensis TaxID=198467 RepID=A0AAW7TJ87_9BACL|nr:MULTISPECIES: hypothetical protein [Anoxybacillus]AKS39715.1 hypothetical protein AFK25_14330 [Anoxybacillus gonensis]KGP61685.1 hypothetical protein NP92_01900 [Anoxybacillus gonensis]MCX8046265.1 hypothetical protein [Anoxybacillus gonensis]MDO0878124.1 hypothetical protein [Anoxybacillus gonensis]
MNKGKLAIFFSIIFICIAVFALRYTNIFDNRQPKNIVIQSGDYVVGKNIREGTYDVIVLHGEVKFMQMKMREGDRWLAVQLRRGEHVYVEGKGKVRLKPSRFEKIERGRNDIYQINHSGFYLVGKQIPEGTYIITYTSHDIKGKPFVQLLSSNRDVIHTYDFQNSRDKYYKVVCEKGQILEVHKNLFAESKHVVVILKKNE